MFFAGDRDLKCDAFRQKKVGDLDKIFTQIYSKKSYSTVIVCYFEIYHVTEIHLS